MVAALGIALVGAWGKQAHPVSGAPGAGPDTPARPAPALAERPNVVVVMADDMRADDLRFAPTVRRLAAGGVRFANSFSPFPLCCPARASFLTGQLAHNHGVYSHEPPFGFAAFDDSETVATALHRGGYRTAFVGKYLNRYGVDTSRVTGEPSWRYVPAGWDDWRATVERGPGSPATGDTYDYFHTSYHLGGAGRPSRVVNRPGVYQTDTLGAMARDAVGDAARGDDPFFLYLSFVAPHFSPVQEPGDPSLLTPQRPDRVKGRFDDVVRTAPGLTRRGVSDPDMSDEAPTMRRVPALDARTRRELVESTRQRAEAISVLDEQVARLVARLKRLGEWRRTVLLFTSDNGYFLGEHHRAAGKMLPHEPSLRVPLVVTGPGVPRGEVRYDPVTTVDLTATVAAYAGASAALDHAVRQDGRSMVPVIEQGDRGWVTPVLTEAMLRWHPGLRGGGFGQRDVIGVRVGGWKLVRFRDGGELYHLDRDPNELRNLWADPAHRGVRRQLLRIWWRTKDCAGADCHPRLPADLAWTPSVAEQHTEAQLAGVRRRTGTPQS